VHLATPDISRFWNIQPEGQIKRPWSKIYRVPHKIESSTSYLDCGSVTPCQIVSQHVFNKNFNKTLTIWKQPMPSKTKNRQQAAIWQIQFQIFISRARLGVYLCWRHISWSLLWLRWHLELTDSNGSTNSARLCVLRCINIETGSAAHVT
jgi:hypothetical protein